MLVLKVFSYEGVVQSLAKYLSIADWYHLRATCTYMYREWMKHRGRQVASGFLEYVKKRFGWTICDDPFVHVARMMLASKLPFANTPDTFHCTGGCGMTKAAAELVAQAYAPYATCAACYAGDTERSGLLTYAIYRRTGDRSMVGISARHQMELINAIRRECQTKTEGVRDFISSMKDLHMRGITKRHYRNITTNPGYEYQVAGPRFVAKSYFDACVQTDLEDYNLVEAYKGWYERGEWLDSLSGSGHEEDNDDGMDEGEPTNKRLKI